MYSRSLYQRIKRKCNAAARDQARINAGKRVKAYGGFVSECADV